MVRILELEMLKRLKKIETLRFAKQCRCTNLRESGHIGPVSGGIGFIDIPL